jgi:chromosome partitioning protein
MRSLVIAASKGGVGKTTAATNLATTLAYEREQRVLVVDLDPDADATRMWALPTSDGLVEVQHGRACLSEVAVPTGVDRLDLVPGSPDLKASIVRTAQDPMLVDWVSDALSRLPDAYDVVLFDTPAGFSVDSLSAALATRQVLATTLLEAGDQASLAAFVRQIGSLARREVELVGVLPCRYDRRRKAPTQILAQLRDAYGDLILDPIPDRAELGELATHAYGDPLAVYHPRSEALSAYRNVLDNLFTMETR